MAKKRQFLGDYAVYETDINPYDGKDCETESEAIEYAARQIKRDSTLQFYVSYIREGDIQLSYLYICKDGVYRHFRELEEVTFTKRK